FWFRFRRVRTTTPASIATATSTGSVKTQGDTESRDQGAASGKTGERDLQDLSRASPPQLRPRLCDLLRGRSRKEAALRRLELLLGRPARLGRCPQGLERRDVFQSLARADGRRRGSRAHRAALLRLRHRPFRRARVSLSDLA